MTPALVGGASSARVQEWYFMASPRDRVAALRQLSGSGSYVPYAPDPLGTDSARRGLGPSIANPHGQEEPAHGARNLKLGWSLKP